ncbi:hypothetical protein BH10BAC1_BH10BAC1_10500 [soil metagenome]
MAPFTKQIKKNCIQKILSLFVLLFFINGVVFSQSIQREVFSSAGNYNSTTTFSLQSNIGELMSSTFTNTTAVLSQGFVQSDQLFTNLASIDFSLVYGNAFPNPVADNLSIEFYALDCSDVVIEVYDILGKMQILETSNGFLNEKYRCDLNFNKITSGIYFVRVSSLKNNYSQIFKVTKA